jgi:hypothetical protein
MNQGHITAVELLPGLNDEEAIKKSHELFAARKNKAGCEGAGADDYPIPSRERADTEGPSAISQNPSSSEHEQKRN